MHECRPRAKTGNMINYISSSLLLHNTFAASTDNGWLLVHETKPHQHKADRLPFLAMCHRLVSRFRHLPHRTRAPILAISFFFFPDTLTDFLKALLTKQDYHCKHPPTSSSTLVYHHHLPSMEPHGPPRRGRPLGIYDDTSDSMDNIGGEWDDHPVRGFGEDGSRRSTRGGPHRRRGAESRGMTDLMDEMSLHERQRRAGGRDLSHIDAMLDEVELHEREQRAGGRGTSHIGAMLDDMESDPRQGGAGGGAHDYERSHLTVRDLPMLKERRAYMMEGMKNARNGEERRTLQVKFNMMTEDIARHEYERRESGKMPRGMGGLVAGTASNSRQSRTGGREPREMSGEFHDDRRKPLNLSELPKLRSDRASMMKSLKYFVESGNDGGCRMAQDNINIINEDIARLELQHRDGSKMPRGMGAPTGHRDREDYTDEESDDYPLGPRRGHSESTAGHGRYSSRRSE